MTVSRVRVYNEQDPTVHVDLVGTPDADGGDDDWSGACTADGCEWDLADEWPIYGGVAAALDVAGTHLDGHTEPRPGA